ncbi:hypothetical protein SERLA73DRAFT_188684 [Serpula lacrymans var. lacrymans S7.3]|uniref:Uncharacterized protein n=1 Tax=Serpula lacrymans var. lacrymans (strain S7.3) TaxID=936435 RepID=F8QBY2_SERL3|nr:hypothetical protein SERLA73DRAFT_188684 [Serpula lacrymans var. lacrymans S7.3]
MNEGPHQVDIGASSFRIRRARLVTVRFICGQFCCILVTSDKAETEAMNMHWAAANRQNVRKTGESWG